MELERFKGVLQHQHVTCISTRRLASSARRTTCMVPIVGKHHAVGPLVSG